MSRPNNRSPDAAARLLKGSALVFAALGGSITAWGLDKWIRYPEARASQFGFEAPLWPAFVVFVVAATTATVLLLWTAARRAETEDDPIESDPD